MGFRQRPGTLYVGLRLFMSKGFSYFQRSNSPNKVTHKTNFIQQPSGFPGLTELQPCDGNSPDSNVKGEEGDQSYYLTSVKGRRVIKRTGGRKHKPYTRRCTGARNRAMEESLPCFSVLLFSACMQREARGTTTVPFPPKGENISFLGNYGSERKALQHIRVSTHYLKCTEFNCV